MAEGIVSYPSLEMILQRAAGDYQPGMPVPEAAPEGMPLVVSGGSMPVPGVAEAAQTTPQEGQSAYERAAQAARERIAAILGRAGQGEVSDRDKWLALALGGARMAASRNPTFFGALGEGAESGIGFYQNAAQRARAEAFRKADQELGAEASAERAGARAEDRVIRREDIANRAVARQDALEARREELAARMEDRRLSREERAEAARLHRETTLEIARLNTGSRERVADIRARAAGAGSTREQRWIEYARERGLVPDTPEGDREALGMIRTGRAGADLERTRANIAAQIYRTMLQDPLDRRSPQEKQAAANAAAEGFLGSPQASPAAAPAPAAPAPAAPPAAAPSASTGPVQVQTPAEAQSLPPGTRYKTPDGRVLVR